MRFVSWFLFFCFFFFLMIRRPPRSTLFPYTTPSDQRVDLLLGADVDPPRGLVEEEHAGPGREPLAEHDLLLVAAGEALRRLLRPGAADREPRDRVAGEGGLAARARDDPEPGQPVLRGQGRVGADREVDHEARALAVLGHEGEPERLGGLG